MSEVQESRNSVVMAKVEPPTAVADESTASMEQQNSSVPDAGTRQLASLLHRRSSDVADNQSTTSFIKYKNEDPSTKRGSMAQRNSIITAEKRNSAKFAEMASLGANGDQEEGRANCRDDAVLLKTKKRSCCCACCSWKVAVILLGLGLVVAVVGYFVILPIMVQNLLDHSGIKVLDVQLLNPMIGGSMLPVMASGQLEQKFSLPVADGIIKQRLKRSRTRVLKRYCVYCDDVVEPELFVRIDKKIQKEFDVAEMMRIGWRQEDEPYISLHATKGDAIGNKNPLQKPTQFGFPGRSYVEELNENEKLSIVLQDREDQTVLNGEDVCVKDMPVWYKNKRNHYKATTVKCADEQITILIKDPDAVDIEGSASASGTMKKVDKTEVFRRFYVGHLVWVDQSTQGRKDYEQRWFKAVITAATVKAKGNVNNDQQYLDGEGEPIYQVWYIGDGDDYKQFPPIPKDCGEPTSECASLPWMKNSWIEGDYGQTSVMWYLDDDQAQFDKILNSMAGSLSVITNMELLHTGPLPASLSETIVDMGVKEENSTGEEEFKIFGKMSMAAMDTSDHQIKLPSTMYINQDEASIDLFQRVMYPQLMGHPVKLHIEGPVTLSTMFGSWDLTMRQQLELPGAVLYDVKGSYVTGHEVVERSGKKDSLKMRVKNMLKMKKGVVVGDNTTGGLGFFIFDMLIPDAKWQPINDLSSKYEALDALLNDPANIIKKELDNLRAEIRLGFERETRAHFRALLKEALSHHDCMPREDGVFNKAITPTDVRKYKFDPSDMETPFYVKFSMKMGRVVIPNFQASEDFTYDETVVGQVQRMSKPDNNEVLKRVFAACTAGENTEMMIYGPTRAYASFLQVGLVQDLTLMGLPKEKKNILRYVQVIQSFAMNHDFQNSCNQLYEFDPNRTDIADMCPPKSELGVNKDHKFVLPVAKSVAANPFNVALVQKDMDLHVEFSDPLSFTAKMLGSYFNMDNSVIRTEFTCDKPTSKFTRSIKGLKTNFAGHAEGMQSNHSKSDTVRLDPNVFTSMLMSTAPEQQPGGNDVHVDRADLLTHNGLCAKMTAKKMHLQKGLSCCFAFMTLASACRGVRANEQHRFTEEDLKFIHPKDDKLKDWNQKTEAEIRHYVQTELFVDYVDLTGTISVKMERFMVKDLKFSQKRVPILGRQKLRVDVFHGWWRKMDIVSDPTCKNVVLNDEDEQEEKTDDKKAFLQNLAKALKDLQEKEEETAIRGSEK